MEDNVYEQAEPVDGEYIVMWQVDRRVQKKGLMNFLLGRTERVSKPAMQRFESEELAEHGYKSLKLTSNVRPVLLKVIKE